MPWASSGVRAKRMRRTSGSNCQGCILAEDRLPKVCGEVRSVIRKDIAERIAVLCNSKLQRRTNRQDAREHLTHYHRQPGGSQ